MYQTTLSRALLAPPRAERKYQAYNLKNFRQIPMVGRLTPEQQFAIEVVGQVLPFRSNNYLVDELIDWGNVPSDPIFALTFPQRDLLEPHQFSLMADLLRRGAPPREITAAANRIRLDLNPHPAGQLEHNVPLLAGERLEGVQHKYSETVLFFPQQGQTCHAFCTFCFRWPQFVGLDGMKFASREAAQLVAYLQEHPEVTDVLFTGGDPMVMRTANLAAYLEPLLAADLPNLHTIRIGTKSLGYWPYRYVTDTDADDLLRLFEKVERAGKHLALMAHFSHPVELSTNVVQRAIERIRATGAQIRTQSPVLNHINADAGVWAELWRKQVQLGLVPYYMFVARDTGAQHFFQVPLVEAWQIFRRAYSQVSGVARTVRGPSMSTHPGKVHVLGVSEINGERVIGLEFLQGRNPDWVRRPFFAEYDEQAVWLDQLRPAFGADEFFFEEELAALAGVPV